MYTIYFNRLVYYHCSTLKCLYGLQAKEKYPLYCYKGYPLSIYLANTSKRITANAPGMPKKPAIKALIMVILRLKPTKEPKMFTNHSNTAPQIPFHTSLKGMDRSLTINNNKTTPTSIGPKEPKGPRPALAAKPSKVDMNTSAFLSLLTLRACFPKPWTE